MNSRHLFDQDRSIFYSGLQEMPLSYQLWYFMAVIIRHHPAITVCDGYCYSCKTEISDDKTGLISKGK